MSRKVSPKEKPRDLYDPEVLFGMMASGIQPHEMEDPRYRFAIYDGPRFAMHGVSLLLEALQGQGVTLDFRQDVMHKLTDFAGRYMLRTAVWLYEGLLPLKPQPADPKLFAKFTLNKNEDLFNKTAEEDAKACAVYEVPGLFLPAAGGRAGSRNCSAKRTCKHPTLRHGRVGDQRLCAYPSRPAEISGLTGRVGVTQ